MFDSIIKFVQQQRLSNMRQELDELIAKQESPLKIFTTETDKKKYFNLSDKMNSIIKDLKSREDKTQSTVKRLTDLDGVFDTTEGMLARYALILHKLNTSPEEALAEYFPEEYPRYAMLMDELHISDLKDDSDEEEHKRLELQSEIEEIFEDCENLVSHIIEAIQIKKDNPVYLPKNHD